MKIIWDSEKNSKLLTERGISFDIFESLILKNEYTEILENKSKKGQMIFIIPYRNYTYAVPFIFDRNGNIVLKTVYPSRKFHKLFGGQYEKNKT